MPNLLFFVPVVARSEFCRMSPLFVGLLLLSTIFVTFSPAVQAQPVEIGSGTLDQEKILGPKWIRVNFDPLISGEHIISVESDSSVDARFSVFQLLDAPSPNNKVRIGMSSNFDTLAEWAGSLDTSEQYYLGFGQHQDREILLPPSTRWMRCRLFLNLLT